MLELHASDEELSDMDAGEEMRLLEENNPSPRSGSPVLPDNLVSSDEELIGDDVDDTLFDGCHGHRPPLDIV